jgi:hypothetical protein
VTATTYGWYCRTSYCAALRSTLKLGPSSAGVSCTAAIWRATCSSASGEPKELSCTASHASVCERTRPLAGSILYREVPARGRGGVGVRGCGRVGVWNWPPPRRPYGLPAEAVRQQQQQQQLAGRRRPPVNTRLGLRGTGSRGSMVMVHLAVTSSAPVTSMVCSSSWMSKSVRSAPSCGSPGSWSQRADSTAFLAAWFLDPVRRPAQGGGQHRSAHHQHVSVQALVAAEGVLEADAGRVARARDSLRSSVQGGQRVGAMHVRGGRPR